MKKVRTGANEDLFKIWDAPVSALNITRRGSLCGKSEVGQEFRMEIFWAQTLRNWKI